MLWEMCLRVCGAWFVVVFLCMRLCMCVGGGAGLPQPFVKLARSPLARRPLACPPPFGSGTAMEAGALVRICSAGHKDDGARGIVMGGAWICVRLFSGEKVFVLSNAAVRTDDGEEAGWLGGRTFISEIDLTNVQHMVCNVFTEHIMFGAQQYTFMSSGSPT
jgi:hypothetical protein